jgi:putative NADH-flavin reductase
MKLLVLGATGGIGIEIVEQALKRGHSVTAFVRASQRLKALAGKIKVVEGNLLDGRELCRVLEGHDAVISGFGPRVPIAKADAHLLRDFAAALTNAMRRAVVPRAIVVSTAFLFKDSLIPPTYLLGRLLFPGVVSDATDMEKILCESGLDITIARPPQLTDKPFSGKYRVREGHLPSFGFSISRADVADFMIHAVENNSYSSAVVGVCN